VRKTSLVACIALSAAAAVAVAAWLYVATFDGNITGFFRFGSVWPPSPFLDRASVLVFGRGEQGYDGQFFLTVALDPGLKSEKSLASLDYPRYRYRRILFPVFGWLFGMGNPRWIPFAMVCLNIACLPMLAALAGAYWRGPDHGAARPLDPLVALCIPGLWISLALTTADLLGSTLLAAALCAGRRGRPALAAAALCLAGLTRETYVASAGAFLLDALMRRDRRQAWHLAWAAAAPVAWNVFAIGRLKGTLLLDRAVGAPFGGLLGKIRELLSAEPGASVAYEAFMLFVLGAAALTLAATCAAEWRRFRLLALCAAPNLAVLAVKLEIWGYYAHYARIATDLCLLLFLTLDGKYLRRSKMAVFALMGLASVAFVLNYARMQPQ
jgi:hypothetical protein